MMGLHVRPRFDNGNELRLLDEAREAGHVYPENDNPGEFVNFFDQESVDWWWENGAMNVVEEGAMFFKTDEGSAFGRKANESNKTGPQGKEIESLHNLFPLAYAKAAFEKFQEYNNMRGMNHTREGYAGIQRYPFIWAGDWPSEWQYFEPVIKAGLNIGMSGVGYWSHNMGGFEHVADPELYIRWVQFGMMSPIAHLFGMEHPNYKEPWNYGEEAQEIFKQYDELRYSLIPYLYSNSYEMHKTGMPLMRALVLEYQDDPNVYEITDQYLLGDDLLICPVTTKEAKTRTVYLPEGKWINYWTGEKFEGKQYLNVLTPIEEMPIFVKAGAIIPTQEVVNYVGEKEINEITLDVYPEGDSSFKLYDDDGKSLDYQNGEFSISEIKMQEDENQIILEINAPEGEFEVAPRSYRLRIHTENEFSEIKINNKSHTKNDDLATYDDKILEIMPKEKSDEEIEVVLTKK
jgi:alpha-glucosidase (family GH31 glycosyl hydrolase)